MHSFRTDKKMTSSSSSTEAGNKKKRAEAKTKRSLAAGFFSRLRSSRSEVEVVDKKFVKSVVMSRRYVVAMLSSLYRLFLLTSRLVFPTLLVGAGCCWQTTNHTTLCASLHSAILNSIKALFFKVISDSIQFGVGSPTSPVPVPSSD